MAVYRMTPARAAALKKAQAASARKRRRGRNRSRIARLVNRRNLVLAAVGGVATHKVVSRKLEQRKFVSDPINQKIINRNVELARYHNWRLNELRKLAIPPQSNRAFDEHAARREAIQTLQRARKKKKKT